MLLCEENPQEFQVLLPVLPPDGGLLPSISVIILQLPTPHQSSALLEIWKAISASKWVVNTIISG